MCTFYAKKKKKKCFNNKYILQHSAQITILEIYFSNSVFVISSQKTDIFFLVAILKKNYKNLFSMTNISETNIFPF